MMNSGVAGTGRWSASCLHQQWKKQTLRGGGGGGGGDVFRHVDLKAGTRSPSALQFLPFVRRLWDKNPAESTGCRK